MATGTTILERSLRMLGVLRPGATSSTAQKAQGLEALNGLLSQLGLERAFVYEVVDESFTWPAATASQTIGASGDFDTNWPVRIETAHVRVDSYDYPLTITYDRPVYDRITDKSTQTQIPSLLFYDRTYPLGALFLRHVPSAELTLYISSWKRLQVFSAIGDTVALPPGYEDMMAWNLAEYLWTEYPNPNVLAKITQMAAVTRGRIKRANPVPMNAQTEIAYAVSQRGRYDINSDA